MNTINNNRITYRLYVYNQYESLICGMLTHNKQRADKFATLHESKNNRVVFMNN